MKGRGRHPDRVLTAVRVNSLKVEGRYGDGNGLYLVVEGSGAKRWLLRIVVQGRRKDIGLGGLRLVTLAEARDKARHYRQIARRGGDPLDELRRARISIPTFADAAKQVHAEHARGWRGLIADKVFKEIHLLPFCYPTAEHAPTQSGTAETGCR